MTRIEITETDILEALADSVSGTGPEGAKTTTEMASETGLSHVRIIKALHVVKGEGRLVVHRVLRRSLDGKLKPTSAYTIAPKKRK